MGWELRRNIVTNIKNIPGWRTRRKIVVIECDDWGSIRMPSKEVYQRLCWQGLKLGTDRFSRFDTLETEKDLDHLFDTLYSVRDKNNHPAVMTPITNMANPDFAKIRSCDFSKYYYTLFTETLKQYYPENNVFGLWREGINAGIFVPELHGREHITVQQWMAKLREGNKDLLIAFDYGFVALETPDSPLPASGFRAEFYFTSEEEKPFLVNSIKDSVGLFENIFGFRPRVFVPSNGIFHPDFDMVVAEVKIKYLYVNHVMPYPGRRGKLKYRYFIPGQSGPNLLTYYTRNCAFEPNDSSYDGIYDTLRQIESAFRWHKPANISTHRVNFAGGIEQKNREEGIKELRKLLTAIVKKWPDVEFMSSSDAFDIMKSGG